MSKKIVYNEKLESLIVLLKETLKDNLELSKNMLFKTFDINHINRLKKFDDLYHNVNVICFDKKILKNFIKADDLTELLTEKDFYNIDKLKNDKLNTFILKRDPMNIDGFEFLAPICFILDKSGYKFIKKYLFDKTNLTIYHDINEFNFRLTEICLSYQKIIDLRQIENDEDLADYDETKNKAKEMIEEIKEN